MASYSDKKPDDKLADIREAFKVCEEAEATNREQARHDLEFGRMGVQALFNGQPYADVYTPDR